MASTTMAGGLVGTGTSARARMTVRALQAFLDQCVEQARGGYVQAMRRLSVRRELHRFARDHQLDRARSRAHAGEAPAMTFVRQLVRLWRADATPAELYQLAAFPLRAVQQLVGGELRGLDQIDLEETRLDGQEDELQIRRRILAAKPHGVTPAALREEAALCAQAVALYQERERALLAAAARIERCGGMVA